MLFLYQRESVNKQIIQNLVEAGLLLPSEVEKQTEQLCKLDPKDLLAVLLESRQLKDESGSKLNYYAIDDRGICEN